MPSHFEKQKKTGDVENFAWCSMGQLCNAAKFDCVRIKDLDEKATIAKLEVGVLCGLLVCVCVAVFIFIPLPPLLPTPISGFLLV